MSQSVNGLPFKSGNPVIDGMPHYAKTTQIRNPSPVNLFVFIDVHEDSIYDALFGTPTLELWGDRRTWWDIPANRHNQGCNFSFADGHAERWKWQTPRQVKVFLAEQFVTTDAVPDYRRFQAGCQQCNTPSGGSA